VARDEAHSRMTDMMSVIINAREAEESAQFASGEIS
jgi:hypothetical protein